MYEPYFGANSLSTASLLLLLTFFIIGFTLLITLFYLYIVCLLDAYQNTEHEMKDRTLWLVLLGGGLFFGYWGIIGPVYYYFYRPRLDFWNNNRSESTL